jgi:PAS domain S-box-containing protein
MKRLLRQRHILLLFSVLVFSVVASSVFPVLMLYRQGVKSAKDALIDKVEIQKKMIEALLTEGKTEDEILTFINQSSIRHLSIGKTGEFVIAKKQNDSIRFLVITQHSISKTTIKDDPNLIVHHALHGESDCIKGIDYRYRSVFGAYTYIPQLKWGIVAKKDTSEINTPYIIIAIATFFLALLLLALCITLLLRLVNPVLKATLRSEQHYRDLFEKNSVTILIIDPSNGQIVDANEAAVSYYGYTYNELLSKKISDINILTEEEIKLRLNETLTGQKRHFIFKHRKADGQVRDVEVYTGKIDFFKRLCLFSIVFDITERKEFETRLAEKQTELQRQNEIYASLNEEYQYANKELLDAKYAIEESFSSFRQLFDNMTNGFALLEIFRPKGIPEDAVFVMANPAYERITNLKGSQIIGRKMSAIFPEEEIKLMKPWIQVGIDGEPLQIEYFSNSIKKHLKAFIYCPRAYFFVIILEDISEQKNTEKELIAAKNKAEESDRLKTAFLQNLSHEIRTPLNAIMGFSELLYKHFDDKERLNYFSKIICQRGNDLLEIINEILDIARIESGQLSMNIEEVSLTHLFNEMLEVFTNYQDQNEKKHIKLTFHRPSNIDELDVLTDGIKLKQIFFNLINNAFKFTKQGHIDVGYKVDSNDQILFYVSDTGIGIPQDKFDEVFDRFVQIKQPSAQIYGGSGLGLTITKGLIQFLGGRIWIESELPKGSTFYFSIPLQIRHKQLQTPTTVEIKSELDTNSIPECVILVVEDDVYNAEMLTEVLSLIKARVLLAINRDEALFYIENNTIDLILMDIRLPDVTGDVLTSEIKARWPQITIIAQTAYASTVDQQRFMEAGCDDYISKPIKPAMLLEKIKQHLKK